PMRPQIAVRRAVNRTRWRSKVPVIPRLWKTNVPYALPMVPLKRLPSRLNFTGTPPTLPVTLNGKIFSFVFLPLHVPVNSASPAPLCVLVEATQRVRRGCVVARADATTTAVATTASEIDTEARRRLILTTLGT